jgi:hypothetical protein
VLGLVSVADSSIAPSCGRSGWIGAESGGAIRLRTVGRSSTLGACRSVGLVAGEHPPDRLGELAGDGDGSDRGSAPAAVAGAVAGSELAVGAVAGCGVGGFDQRPAQIVGPVLGECAAPVAPPGSGRGGRVRPAPRRRSGRSYTPTARVRVSVAGRRAARPRLEARAGRGRSGRRSSPRSPPTRSHRPVDEPAASTHPGPGEPLLHRRASHRQSRRANQGGYG